MYDFPVHVQSPAWQVFRVTCEIILPIKIATGTLMAHGGTAICIRYWVFDVLGNIFDVDANMEMLTNMAAYTWNPIRS